MNSIAALISAIAAFVGSLALAINAITKFRTAVVNMRAGAETKAEAKRNGLTRLDLFYFIAGIASMVLGIAGLIFMLIQKDGPATMHEVVIAAMCLVNVMSGNLILVAMTIKANSTNWVRSFLAALRDPTIE